MPSRNVSNETFYPFVPDRTNTDAFSVMEAVKDVFFVVQGTPTAFLGGNVVPQAFMTAVTLLGTKYTLSFVTYQGDYSWEFQFDVNENEGIVEASVSPGSDVRGVMIVDTDALTEYLIPVPIEVEPARAIWNTEQIDSITFANIRRLDGVEDASVEVDILTLNTDPIVVSLEAGHNTEWSVDDDGAAVLTVAEGIGLGRNEDYGDTVAGGAEPIDADNIVRVVNGIQPIVGDIPVTVSASMSIETSKGLVEIVRRSS